MTRRKRDADREAFETGILSFLAFGRMTASEAARRLGVSHTTINRRAAALGVDPVMTRERELDRMTRQAMGHGKRKATKADLKRRAANAKRLWDQRQSPPQAQEPQQSTARTHLTMPEREQTTSVSPL